MNTIWLKLVNDNRYGIIANSKYVYYLYKSITHNMKSDSYLYEI